MVLRQLPPAELEASLRSWPMACPLAPCWAAGQRLGGGAPAQEGVAASGGVARVAAPRRGHLAGVPGQDGVEERYVFVSVV